MIRMIQSTSSKQAKKYFNEALSETKYYLDSQELCGRFLGRVAARLNFGSLVTKDIFYLLCDNINPMSGKSLTPRVKDYRTIGYDINFHCPKSVSILNAFSKDDHILTAFQQSVYETMCDIEADAKTRVRIDNKDTNRQTGELIWGDFVHLTSRPLKGFNPDPHLHSHCFTFNVTWDETENRYKAAQFRDIKQDMPYYQAKFNKTLSDKLINLGYKIRRTKQAFEVVGVPEEVITLFSKRTNEIDEAAIKQNLSSARDLDGLGARTRSKKQTHISMAVLVEDWRNQVKSLKLKSSAIILHKNPSPELPLKPAECIEYAESHCFERVSVVPERQLLAQAYLYGMGNSTVSADGITDSFDNNDSFIKIKEPHKTLCTTKELISEETRMLTLAQNGIGTMPNLYGVPPVLDDLGLVGEQAEAVAHILTTRDRVSIISGKAGTGKTTLMQAAVKLIESTGIKVKVVAPTAQASRGVLRQEGFETAETVAKLLTTPELQAELVNGALWVDEAGLLGIKDMTALLELATKTNSRLILSGDTRQHASVVRGDALRILSTIAQIPTLGINTIYRQKNEAYKKAIYELSDGNIEAGFKQLHEIGAIKQIDETLSCALLVEDYFSALNKGKSALVISPTHYQGDLLTAEIRKRLRLENRIGKEDIQLKRFVNSSFTEAEKQDYRNYQQHQVIQFNQHLPMIKRGSSWTVWDVIDNKVIINNKEGCKTELPLMESQKFEVYNKKEIDLAKGDVVQITRNGFDIEKKRLNNGQILTMLAPDKKGNLRFKNMLSKVVYTLDKEFGHLNHAHCITSHASQGKTVDEVFIMQSTMSFPATNAKQFYVSASRAREKVHIYTDDPEALLQNASNMGDRLSALELINSPSPIYAQTEPSFENEQFNNAPLKPRKVFAHETT